MTVTCTYKIPVYHSQVTVISGVETLSHFHLFLRLRLPIYIVYSSVSIYWTLTRFIGQCLAGLTVSTPLTVVVLLNWISTL